MNARPARVDRADRGDHETVLPQQAVAPAAELAPALALWQQRLAAAGLACQGVALHAADPAWQSPFVRADVSAAWAEARGRVSAESPVALARIAAGGLLVATQLALPSGEPGIVGALLSPPHDDRSLQLLLLSLGWLQLTLSAASLAHNQRAAELLQLMAQVGSQANARAAAQDWIDRSAAWARSRLAPGAALRLSLFEVRFAQARWWVGANTSHAEIGSPAVQAATEVAQRAFVEQRELDEGGTWALPLLAEGETVAVLFAGHDGTALPPEARRGLTASALLAEPLLRHWREAERPLPTQAWLALRRTGQRLCGPGHRAWKLGAAGVLAAAVALLLVPVDDRVTASTVIEGRTRHLVTAPFEGYIAQVQVRPGDRVHSGQVLLRLDDRELRLDAARLRGERDQAAGRLRQAMAERDAPGVALARAEVQGAEGQLALAEAKLARAELRSPMEGLVVGGDWVQQIGTPLELGKEVFEIASADAYRVVLHVPERDIARVRVGQPGVLRLAGQPHAAQAFELSRVTATASVQDAVNGFRAEAAWVGEAPPLSPGMQGVAKVTVGRANLLTVWTRESWNWLRIKLWQYGL